MKIQDIFFLIIFLILVFKSKSAKPFILAGMVCFILAMPFFYFWIFFTAQRLVWYAVAFILAGVIFLIKHK